MLYLRFFVPVFILVRFKLVQIVRVMLFTIHAFFHNNNNNNVK